MLIRTLALAALFAAPLPALAQEMTALDSVASVLLGLQGGSKTSSGAGGVTDVNQTGPGAFEVEADGRTMTLTVTETDACQFDVVLSLDGNVLPTLHVDPSKLNGVTYHATTTEDSGLTMYNVEIDAEPGFAVNTASDGTTSESDIPNNIRTDVTIEALNAAATALTTCGDTAATDVGSAAPASTTATTDANVANVAPEALDLVAKVLLGTVDGADVAAPPAFSDRVERMGDGVFKFDDGDGPPVMLTITASAPCVFDLDLSINDESQGRIRFDATKLAGLNYSGGEGEYNRFAYKVELKGAPGLLSFVTPDGSLSEAPNSADFESSLSIDELRAGAKAFQKLCRAA